MFDIITDAMRYGQDAIRGVMDRANSGTTPTTQAGSSSKTTQVSRLLAGAKQVNGAWQLPGAAPMNNAAFMQMLNNAIAIDGRNGASQQDIAGALGGAGLDFALGGEGGAMRLSDVRPRGSAAGTPSAGTPSTPASPGGSPGSPGGGGTMYTGGAGTGGAGGGGGSSGGARTPGYNAGAPVPQQGGTRVTETQTGGGGGGSTMNINPNAPLGFRNPGSAGPPLNTGNGYFSGGGMPAPGSIFDGLPQNPTLNDIIGQITRRQEQNRDAALSTLGGVFNESLNGANGQNLRGQVNNLLQNPYSLNENTIQQIMGRTTDGIAQRANTQSQQAAARAASMGMGRSGSAMAQQGGIQNRAASDIANNERNVRTQAAIQNGQDLRSAIGVGGQAIQGDVGMRANLAGTAARDVLGTTQMFGDAFLTNALLGANGQGSGQRVGVPSNIMGSGAMPGNPWTYV